MLALRTAPVAHIIPARWIAKLCHNPIVFFRGRRFHYHHRPYRSVDETLSSHPRRILQREVGIFRDMHPDCSVAGIASLRRAVWDASASVGVVYCQPAHQCQTHFYLGMPGYRLLTSSECLVGSYAIHLVTAAENCLSNILRGAIHLAET